jgi:hypothetical protein
MVTIMNTQYDEKIRILRDSTDWTSCRESLAVLATTLNQENVVDIILDQERQFLLRYLEDTPDDPAISKAISVMASVDGLEDLRSKSQIIRNILQGKAGTPGINTYRSAMREIGQIAAFDCTSIEDIELFVNAVSAIILATEDYVWGVKHRELWQKSFEHKNREDFFIRANHFVTDPQIIDLNKKLWSQIAEAIEKAIQ